jgi:hypothetical protein
MSPIVQRYVVDPLERAVSTFVQAFAVLLVGTGSVAVVGVQEWAKAADVAGFAAILSLITSILTFSVPQLPVAWDIIWRTFKTGLQAFFGVLAADQMTHSVLHADWKAALAVAVPVALAALLKSVAALAAPWSDGASLAPRAA